MNKWSYIALVIALVLAEVDCYLLRRKTREQEKIIEGYKQFIKEDYYLRHRRRRTELRETK